MEWNEELKWNRVVILGERGTKEKKKKKIKHI